MTPQYDCITMWTPLFTLPARAVLAKAFSILYGLPSGSSTVLARRRERVSRLSCTLSCSIARSIIGELSTEMNRGNRLARRIYLFLMGVCCSWASSMGAGRRGTVSLQTHWLTVHTFFFSSHSALAIHIHIHRQRYCPVSDTSCCDDV